jgi:hypothetical protein
MTRKLESVFNLPEITEDQTATEIVEQETGMSTEQMQELMATADKIDAALPQVGGLDSIDADFDRYAALAIEAFEDLMDLSKNVEDRHTADIANAASSMLGNALTAKTNKANRKLETVKQQINKAKLEHEKKKLRYLEQRHLKKETLDDPIESEGTVIGTRADLIRDMLAELKNEDK